MSTEKAKKQEVEPETKEEAIERLKKRSEYLLDMDNMKPQEHRWVDRGAKMSCEGAGHPHHEAFKRR